MKLAKRFFVIALSLVMMIPIIQTLPVYDAKAAELTPVGVHGQLQVKGTKIVDQNGKQVQLRGISTHGITWDVGYPYVNEAAFKELRDDWGANTIRLAMYTADYNGYCTGGNQAELKNLVHNGVTYAKNLGMYAIIDWHILSDGDPNTYIDTAKVFFDEMSEKYKDYNNVIYEICNEPNGCSWDDIKKYANVIIPIIRENDKDAIIIVGTPTWSQLGAEGHTNEVADSPLTGYSNIVYSLHFYCNEASHTQYLPAKVDYAMEKGVPVIVSEFGLSAANGTDGINTAQAKTWFDKLDGYGIGYFCWSISHKDETSALLNKNNTKTSGWLESDLSEAGKFIKGEFYSRREILSEETDNDSDSTESTTEDSSDNGESGECQHKGGNATCVKKAVCEICKEEYGNLNAINHINTEIRNAKVATATELGYTGDTYCVDCNTLIQKGTDIPLIEADDKEDVTPDDEDNADDKEDVTPDDEDNADDKEDVTPDDEDNADDKGDVTPDDEDNADDKEDVTPDDEDNASDKEDVTPDDEDNASDKEDITPDDDITSEQPAPNTWGTNQNGDKVYYDSESNKVNNTWLQIDSEWYHFGVDGVAQTGWIKDNEVWYYLDDEGIMETGWILDGANWYFLNESGAMQTGWVYDGFDWYYMDYSGAMQTGWLLDGDTWYYLMSSGAMVVGWVKDCEQWYYMNGSGAMVVGWINDGVDWYYSNSSGAMLTGWIHDGKAWYYMYDSGKMAYNTVIKGYTLNANGAWVK